MIRGVILKLLLLTSLFFSAPRDTFWRDVGRLRHGEITDEECDSAIKSAPTHYATFSISGTVYSNHGVTTVGSGYTVKCSLNGGAAVTTTTAAGGTFTFSGLNATAPTVCIFLASGQTYTGASVYSVVGVSTSSTGFNVYHNTALAIKPTNNSGTNSIAKWNTAGGLADAGISNIFAATSTTITTASGVDFYVGPSATQTTVNNSTVTVSGSLYVAGTLSFTNLGSSLAVTGGVSIISGGTLSTTGNAMAVTCGGSWSNAGTFSAGTTSTVTLNGTGTQTISGSTTFNNLVITNSAGTIKVTDGTTQTFSATQFTNCTITGTSTGGYTFAMPVAGSQTNSGITLSYCTATGNQGVAGAGSTDGGNNVNWTFGGGPPSTPALPPTRIGISNGIRI